MHESPGLSTSMEPTSLISTNGDTTGVILMTVPATSSEDIDTRSNLPPSFSDVIQVPKQLRQPSLRRKHKVAHAEIITSSPYKNELNKKKHIGLIESTKETDNMNQEQQNKKQRRTGQNATKKTRILRPKTQKTKSRKHNDDDDNTFCLYCKGSYKESIEGWIQCTGQCKMWAGVDSQGPANFVCELCGDID